MKYKCLSCLSSFICAVMLFMSMAAPAFAVSYFVPSTDFPCSEDLPFGYNCVVVDIVCQANSSGSDVGFWRFFVPYGTVFQVQRSSTKYIITFIFSSQYTLASTNTFYCQGYDAGSTPSGNISTLHSSYNSTIDAETAEFTTNNVATRYFKLYSNYSAYSDNSGTYLASTFKAYPSSSDRVVSEVNSNVDRAITELNSENQSRHIADMTQASQNHAADMTQRSQQHSEDVSQRSAQHSEIMDAGANEPTLDTDTNWMDDSISKMNGWLDDLSNFDAQMSNNRVQNADNMSKAAGFLNSFFGSVPAAVIAAMALCLVVIVVVKIVGR